MAYGITIGLNETGKIGLDWRQNRPELLTVVLDGGKLTGKLLTVN
jgi:hypothetical protein